VADSPGRPPVAGRPQFQRRQRVESLLQEASVEVDGGRVRVAEHDGRVPQHQIVSRCRRSGAGQDAKSTGCSSTGSAGRGPGSARSTDVALSGQYRRRWKA